MSAALSIPAEIPPPLLAGDPAEPVPHERHLIAMNALADIASGHLPEGTTPGGAALAAINEVIAHEFNDRMLGLPDVMPNGDVEPSARLQSFVRGVCQADALLSGGLNKQAACSAIQAEIGLWRGTPHGEAVATALGSLARAFGVAPGVTSI
jgi:hypothetical protein